MFEKEAEDSFNCKKVLYKWETDKRSYIDGFKDGAEFGYNKANEWHYVKDGEYPTHSNGVLVFTDEGVGFGIYGLDDKKWHTYDTGFDVVAWKEIVLPELKGVE